PVDWGRPRAPPLASSVAGQAGRLIAFHADPGGLSVKKSGRAGQDRAGGHDVGSRYDALRHAVTDRRPDVSPTAAIADGSEASLQNVCRVARGFQRVELHALLELELPDVGLVTVIGEVGMDVDQAGHNGQACDVDDVGIPPIAQLLG